MKCQHIIALERIAMHFLGCDLTGDESAQYIVRIACEALGWIQDKDQYGQESYIKPGTSEYTERMKSK